MVLGSFKYENVKNGAHQLISGSTLEAHDDHAVEGALIALTEKEFSMLSAQGCKYDSRHYTCTNIMGPSNTTENALVIMMRAYTIEGKPLEEAEELCLFVAKKECFAGEGTMIID